MSGERTEILSWRSALASEAQLAIVTLYKHGLAKFGTQGWDYDILLSLKTHLFFADPRPFGLLGDGFGLRVVGFSKKRIPFYDGEDVAWLHRIPSVTFHESRSNSVPVPRQGELNSAVLKVINRVMYIDGIETTCNPVIHRLRMEYFYDSREFVNGAPLGKTLA